MQQFDASATILNNAGLTGPWALDDAEVQCTVEVEDPPDGEQDGAAITESPTCRVKDGGNV